MLKQFETTPFTLSLQLIQAHFMTFSLKNQKKESYSQESVRIQLNEYQAATAKMELAYFAL
jgi:hypothetical protein